MKFRTQIFENIDKNINIGDELYVSEENLHHLRDVLRVKDGELIQVVINQAKIAEAEVLTEKKAIKAKIVKIDEIEEAPSPVRSLCFAFCKSAQNELVVEKATELGIKNIIFWRSDHLGIKLKEPVDKVSRLERIAEAAARQSKQKTLPKIVFKDDLRKTLEYLKETFPADDTIVFASLRDGTKTIKELAPVIKNAHIFIGPEGGFSEKEEHELAKFGVALTLGNSVLKAETAAIVAIAQVMAVI